MPPSSKRRPRRRETELTQNTSDMDVPDSSPSRPSTNKRRKTNGAASAANNRTRPPTKAPIQPHRAITPALNDESEVEHDQENEHEPVADQDVVDSVISYLDVSKDFIAVMEEHSNAKAREGDRDSVKAYAKIAGRDWTYYVKEPHVTIGRPPDNRPALQSSPIQDGSQPASDVDIDLGPSKFVSRLHAEIYFDSAQDPACWRIRVIGRNGVRLNNIIMKRGSSAEVNCGDVIEIAGTQMMFVTPDRKAAIHPFFLEKAHRPVPEEEPVVWNSPHLEPSQPMPRRISLLSNSARPQLDALTAVAAAQPGFKRETTPMNTQVPTMPGSTVKKSPLYERGLMLQSTEEIDYSKDSSKDLKPPFPYSQMIAQAILSSPEQKLTLNNIYNWIMDHYAYYKHLGATSGWQNSIRHNLSLNKAFQKVPRRTDEPGKGMKWQIDPDQREEFLKKQGKKGNQSNPSSPAARDPNFRGPNGQNLGYDRSYEGSFSAIKGSPQVTSPGFTSFPVVSKEAMTPDRGTRPARRIQYDANDMEEQSPLPRSKANALNRNNWTFSDASTAGNNNNVTSTQTSVPSNATVPGSVDSPVLSSSYYDNDGGPASSMITPAPRRQQPRLAPPSTAQIPSKFMPMSSPAQFWKFADLGSTPARTPMVPDMSPIKASGLGRDSGVLRGRSGVDDDEGGRVPSSSPPPQAGGLGGIGEGSPCKRVVPRLPELSSNGGGILKREAGVGIGPLIKEEESDLRTTVNGNGLGIIGNGTNGVVKFAPGPILPPQMNNNHGRGRPASGPQVPGAAGTTSRGGAAANNEEEEGPVGFDLAKGFQSIGAYHQQVTSAARASS